jgi:hypothetical protein
MVTRQDIKDKNVSNIAIKKVTKLRLENCSTSMTQTYDDVINKLLDLWYKTQEAKE